MIRRLLFTSLLTFSLFTLVGCNDLLSKGKELATNESTVAPTLNLDDEGPQEEPVDEPADEPVEKVTVAPTKEVEATKKPVVTKAPSNNASSNANSANSVVFNDFLNTQEYVVKTTGTYTFSCKPSDGKTTWDIYVLDEKFEDALRYLTNAYEPVLTATSKATTYKLTKGQYVYCVCSQNSFSFEGDKNTFKCPLTIALN